MVAPSFHSHLQKNGPILGFSRICASNIHEIGMGVWLEASAIQPKRCVAQGFGSGDRHVHADRTGGPSAKIGCGAGGFSKCRSGRSEMSYTAAKAGTKASRGIVVGWLFVMALVVNFV